MKKKHEFTKEAAELQKRFSDLKNFIYLGGVIKNYDDFKTAKLLCEHWYRIEGPRDNIVTFEYLVEIYSKKLPDVVHELKTLQSDVSEFMTRVKHRAPHLLKIGKFSETMTEIISAGEIRKTIVDAESIINHCATNPLENNGVEGARVLVNYKKMKERVEYGLSDSNIRVKKDNE